MEYWDIYFFFSLFVYVFVCVLWWIFFHLLLCILSFVLVPWPNGKHN